MQWGGNTVDYRAKVNTNDIMDSGVVLRRWMVARALKSSLWPPGDKQAQSAYSAYTVTVRGCRATVGGSYNTCNGASWLSVIYWHSEHCCSQKSLSMAGSAPDLGTDQ